MYLSRDNNNTSHQLSILDDAAGIVAEGFAFDDDESLFSALAGDESNILVGDNNEFSSIPNRIAHLSWDGDSLTPKHQFDFEDPISMVIVDDWALIASGYGNALWQYQISTQNVRAVVDIPLPSLVLRQGDYVYAAGNTQIQKLELSNSGFTVLEEVVQLEGVSGIIGAMGVFGVF